MEANLVCFFFILLKLDMHVKPTNPEKKLKDTNDLVHATCPTKETYYLYYFGALNVI